MTRPASATVYQQKANGALAMLIPREIGNALGVEKGQQLLVYVDDGRMVCEPMSRYSGRGRRSRAIGAGAPASA
jgi:antitoxin component of MazEF toxin-antitoxin module